MPDPRYGLVDGVDKFAEVLLLAPHLDVRINLLEHWEKVLGPQESTHLPEEVEPML
jgi:hypothetical protein